MRIILHQWPSRAVAPVRLPRHWLFLVALHSDLRNKFFRAVDFSFNFLTFCVFYCHSCRYYMNDNDPRKFLFTLIKNTQYVLINFLLLLYIYLHLFNRKLNEKVGRKYIKSTNYGKNLHKTSNDKGSYLPN